MRTKKTPNLRTSSSKQVLAENVRRIRKEKNLSCAALSRLAKLGTTYISMTERGLQDPTLDVLDKIAHALDVKTSDLLLDHGSLDKDEAIAAIMRLLQDIQRLDQKTR